MLKLWLRGPTSYCLRLALTLHARRDGILIRVRVPPCKLLPRLESLLPSIS